MLAKVQTTNASIRQRNAEGDDTGQLPQWRDLVAEGLYHMGALRILEAVARHYEFRKSNRRGLAISRRAAHPKFVVLCYHRIGMHGIPLFSELPPEVFEAQMRYVAERYRVLSLDDLCEEMDKPTRKADAVAVTFDDGYRDLHAHALPILRKYQIPATIFLPVASIETGQVPWYDRIFLALKVFPKDELEIVLDRPRSFRLGSFHARLRAATEIIQYLRTLPDLRRKEYCSTLEEQVILPQDELKDRMLTWDLVRAMYREGINFGSHTMTHPVVSQLTDFQLESELGESKQVLEQRIGGPALHFAYPFGQPADCGTAALPLLVRNGYRSAATTIEGTNEPGDNRYQLCRSQVGNERSLAMFALKLNQLFLSSGAAHSTSTAPDVSSVLGKPPVESKRQQRRVTNA